VVQARDGEREMEGKRGMRGQPAPHTTATSNCSWGGYGVQVHRNDRKWERGDDRDATLCVDDDTSILFILFHLKLVVIAPLPERRGYYLVILPHIHMRGNKTIYSVNKSQSLIIVAINRYNVQGNIMTSGRVCTLGSHVTCSAEVWGSILALHTLFCGTYEKSSRV
jgi:hypothetical protein